MSIFAIYRLLFAFFYRDSLKQITLLSSILSFKLDFIDSSCLKFFTKKREVTQVLMKAPLKTGDLAISSFSLLF